MLNGDLHATRDNPAEPLGPGIPRFDEGAPVRLVGAPEPPPLRTRIRQVAAGTLVSALVHAGLAIAFLIVWRAMIHDLTAPEPISVELVRSVPEVKPKPAVGAPKQPEAQSAPAAAPLPKPAPPPTPLPPPAAPDTGGREGEPPKSALVEPPPEPRRAATQVEPDRHPTLSDDKPQSLPPPPAAGPVVPTVLAAPGGETTVPAPPPPAAPPGPKPVDADQPPRADAAATLAAALPSMALDMPSSFRAILSSAGSAESRDYKGVVYGMLGRGRARAVAEDAERRGLKGQVIVALTIDDGGAVDRIGVVRSSGHDDVDQAALALVRAAAPFPPPPAGTEHSFTPAIAFGDRE